MWCPICQNKAPPTTMCSLHQVAPALLVACETVVDWYKRGADHRELEAINLCENAIADAHKEGDVPLTPLQRARWLVERKCQTKSCWHRSAPGYIFCTGCRHGTCSAITGDDRTEIENAMALLAAEDAKTTSETPA